MLAARTIDRFLHFLDLVNVSWCVFQGPKGSLDEIVLFRVQLVNAYWFHILLGDLSSFGRSLYSIGKLMPSVDLLKSFILLKGLQFQHFLLHFFLLLLQLLPFYNLFNICLLFSYFFLLFHQKLDNAGAAKHVSLIAASGLDEAVIADCAHLELLNGILADSGLIGAVDSFELLALAVGED